MLACKHTSILTDRCIIPPIYPLLILNYKQAIISRSTLFTDNTDIDGVQGTHTRKLCFHSRMRGWLLRWTHVGRIKPYRTRPPTPPPYYLLPITKSTHKWTKWVPDSDFSRCFEEWRDGAFFWLVKNTRFDCYFDMFKFFCHLRYLVVGCASEIGARLIGCFLCLRINPRKYALKHKIIVICDNLFLCFTFFRVGCITSKWSLKYYSIDRAKCSDSDCVSEWYFGIQKGMLFYWPLKEGAAGDVFLEPQRRRNLEGPSRIFHANPEVPKLTGKKYWQWHILDFDTCFFNCVFVFGTDFDSFASHLCFYVFALPRAEFFNRLYSCQYTASSWVVQSFC